MVEGNYRKNKSERTRPTGNIAGDIKESDYDPQREQINFSMRVENYMRRHPEFLDELQRRMDADESGADNYKGNDKDIDDKVAAGSKKENKYSDEGTDAKSIRDFAHLSESDMVKISGEISGLLFKKDESHKSFLEKKAEEAVSGMVYKYLSNFMR